MSGDVQGLAGGDLVLLGLAAASAWMLVVRDKLTQPLRHWFVRRVLRRQTPVLDRTDPGPALLVSPSRNRFTYWLEYLVGCALCFPVWAAGTLLGTTVWGPSWLNDASRFVQFVLAARLLAWGALKWLRDETVRDWPSEHEWPPPSA